MYIRNNLAGPSVACQQVVNFQVWRPDPDVNFMYALVGENYLDLRDWGNCPLNSEYNDLLFSRKHTLKFLLFRFNFRYSKLILLSLQADNNGMFQSNIKYLFNQTT